MWFIALNALLASALPIVIVETWQSSQVTSTERNGSAARSLESRGCPTAPRSSPPAHGDLACPSNDTRHVAADPTPWNWGGWGQGSVVVSLACQAALLPPHPWAWTLRPAPDCVSWGSIHEEEGSRRCPLQANRRTAALRRWMSALRGSPALDRCRTVGLTLHAMY